MVYWLLQELYVDRIWLYRIVHGYAGYCGIIEAYN